MKINMFLIFFVLSVPLFAQGKGNLTVFYFGATSCGPCNRPEVVKSIKKMKKEFSSVHKDYKTKFVMVCLDDSIPEGLNFINKYGYWDEISVGSWFHNELVLANLNKTNMPGAPHILIYKVTLMKAKYGVELIKKKILAKEILGGNKIVDWVNAGYSINKE